MYSPLAHWQVRDCSFPIETNEICVTHGTLEEVLVLDKFKNKLMKIYSLFFDSSLIADYR
jgi:hypothetical protein